MSDFIIYKLITIYIVMVICTWEGIHYIIYYAKRKSTDMKKEIEALSKKKVLQFKFIVSIFWPIALIMAIIKTRKPRIEKITKGGR